MEYKDSGSKNKTMLEAKRYNFSEHDSSPWDIKKRTKLYSKGHRICEMFDTYSLLLVLAILSVVISGSMIGVNVSFYSRLRNLEKDVLVIADIDKKNRLSQNQEAISETVKQRLERFEQTMTARLDSMVNDLNSLREKAVEPQALDSVSSNPEIIEKKPKVKRYHTVQQGETLYTISRMYGLTVKEIKMKNKLSASAVIYPGQKIFVSY